MIQSKTIQHLTPPQTRRPYILSPSEGQKALVYSVQQIILFQRPTRHANTRGFCPVATSRPSITAFMITGVPVCVSAVTAI